MPTKALQPQRMRHVDGAQRRLLQMRKLRQHQRVQLNIGNFTGECKAMSAAPRAAFSTSETIAHTRGFLHIVRHGNGPNAVYVLTYHRLDRDGVRPKPLLAEGAQPLLDLLDRIGVDFRLSECARRARGISAPRLRQYSRPLAQRRKRCSRRASLKRKIASWSNNSGNRSHQLWYPLQPARP